MSIPETLPSPQIVDELNTIEQWRQKTNSIINRLNSLYTLSNNLEVGNSIYANNLQVGSEEILICGTDGLIKNSGVTISDLNDILGGTISGNLDVTGILSISDTTESTTCNTGALQVAGGVGIAKNLYVCGNITNVGDGTTTGILTATKLIGDGSGITNLNVPPGVWISDGNNIYYDTGYVGVGGTPSQNFHVQDSSGCNVLIQTTDTSTPKLDLQNSGAIGTLRLSGNDLQLVSGSNILLSGGTSSLDVSLSNGKLFIDNSTSRVGIGTLTPSEALDVSGNITASGDIVSTSDISLKENVELILNPIEKVKELNGYTFNRIGQQKRSVGLMAQEVEKVLPEAVMKNRDGIKSLAYGNLIALLVETVKEQQKQIDELRKNIDK